MILTRRSNTALRPCRAIHNSPVSLSQQITSSLKWTAFGKAASQAVSWVVTMYVIRILAPGDYGLMAMASVVIAFLSTFNKTGLYNQKK